MPHGTVAYFKKVINYSKSKKTFINHQIIKNMTNEFLL